MSNKNKYNRTVTPDEIEAAVSEEEAVPTVETAPVVEDVPVQETATPAETPVEPVRTTTTTADVPTKKLPVKEDRNAAKLAELERLLNNYKTAVSVANPPEPVRTKFVQEFSKLISFMFNANSYPVYNRFLEFVIAERNGAMRNTTALCGIHKLRDQRKREEISSFYTVMYALGRAIAYQTPFRLSVKAIRISINNEIFINWLINKINR